MGARRNEEILPVRRVHDGIQAGARGTRGEWGSLAVGKLAVHRETYAIEDLGGRSEGQEMQSGRTLAALFA